MISPALANDVIVPQPEITEFETNEAPSLIWNRLSVPSFILSYA